MMSAQKTFKQFIEEKWLRGDLENYYGNTSRKNTITHTSSIDGHEVKVHVKHEKNGSRNISFSVNGEKLRQEHLNSKHGVNILRHVGKVVDHYTSKRKPVAIEMHGNTGDKKRLYKTFADHLQKKHGGKIIQDYDKNVSHSLKLQLKPDRKLSFIQRVKNFIK